MECVGDGISVFVLVATVGMSACQQAPVDSGSAPRSSALSFPGRGERVFIDFETDAAGAPLTRGTVLAEQYAAVGIHFENSFIIGDHATDFPNAGNGNMLCTHEAGVDPATPGR